MRKILSPVITFLVVVVLASPTAVLAREGKPERPGVVRAQEIEGSQAANGKGEDSLGGRIRDLHERISNVRELRGEARCIRIRENLQTRAEIFSTVRTRRSQAYSQLLLNLEQGIERLTELGYDTSELESVLAKLQELFGKFNMKHQEIAAIFAAAANLPCDSAAQLREAAASISRVTGELRKVAAEIRQVVKEELKLALQAVRAQKVNN